MTLEERAAALPAVKFVCGRDFLYPDAYQIGFFWSKTKTPVEGSLVYQKWWTIRIHFRIFISNSTT